MVFTKKLVRISPEIDWYSHQWPPDGKMWYVTAVLVKIHFFLIVPSAGPLCTVNVLRVFALCYSKTIRTWISSFSIFISKKTINDCKMIPYSFPQFCNTTFPLITNQFMIERLWSTTKGLKGIQHLNVATLNIYIYPLNLLEISSFNGSPTVCC